MGFTVTCKELPILMRQLRAADRELSNDIKRQIRKAEQPAKRAMQESAAAAGMMKAARAVKIRNRFSGKSASLGLRVDSGIAPNARPLDKPNNGDFDRHPVFGRDRLLRQKRFRVFGLRFGRTVLRTGTVWVDQPARRFFNRGADEGFKQCTDAMQAALDELVRSLS